MKALNKAIRIANILGMADKFGKIRADRLSKDIVKRIGKTGKLN